MKLLLVGFLTDVDVVVTVAQHPVDEPSELSSGGEDGYGCMAHVRRKLFDALTQASEAQQALDLIRELYLVEHEAANAGVVRKPAHLTLRQTKSGPVMERLRAWLDDQKPKHLPKSAMGEAISYALNSSLASQKVRGV